MPLRSTQIRSIATDNPDPAILEEAAAILRDGGLVAFATETVYGLGADATNPDAVAKIFEAKGRPATNPLIVHAADMEMARLCVCGWTGTADMLAWRFWPGPLTLVLPRSGIIPDIVTAGRVTVGIRIPDPPSARALIKALGRPIAAPSANRSNRISPTRAGHVAKDLDGRIDLILDGGPTSVGLESTVVDVRTDRPRVLRPGPITVRELARAIGDRPVDEGPNLDEPGAATSPGQMPVHYAPTTKAVRVSCQSLETMPLPPGQCALLLFGPGNIPTKLRFAPCYEARTPEDAACTLYLLLHELDAMGLSMIVVVLPPDRPEWRAIRDRLLRLRLPCRVLCEHLLFSRKIQGEKVLAEHPTRTTAAVR